MAYFDYMMDSTGFANPVMETEEERRARLERERLAAMQAPTAPVKPTPVKETITTDPVTGERKVKIEGSEADLSAMNTRTPTISRPSQQLPPGAVTLPQDFTKPPVQPQTVPMDPTKPPPQMLRVGAEPPVAPVAPETVVPPPPPAATQPAAVAPTPPAAPQPPLGGGLQVRPQQAEAFMPGEIAGMPSTEVPTVSREYEPLLQGAAVNATVRNRLITDPNTPADVRRAAIVLERRDLERQRETGAAQKELQQAVQSGNMNAIARRIKQESEGGSIFKALMYKALGMTNLALEEEKKMGAGRKWQTVINPTTNERALIEFDADGLPLGGFDNAGRELSQDQIAQFGAAGTAGKDFDVVGGTYVNDDTGEVGRVVTPKGGTQSFVQTSRGLVPLGKGWRPQSSTGSLQQQYATQMQTAMINFTMKPSEAAAAELKKQAALADPGDGSQIRATDNLIAKLLPSAVPGGLPQAQPPVPGTTAGQAPAGPVAPVQTPPAGQTAPVQTPPAGQTAPVQAPPARPAGIPSGAPKQPGESFEAYNRRKDREGDERKARLEVGTEQQKAFATKTIPVIGEQATGGREVSAMRRQQIDLINRNPTIVNIMNGDDSRYARARAVLRDIVTGAYNAENPGDFAQALGQLNLTSAEKGALQEYWNINAQINPRTLRANTGGGQISNAEQKINKDANIQNIDRMEVYSVMSGLHRSQYQADMNAAKQSFLDRNPNITTDREWNAKWAKQQAVYMKAYEGILRARAEFIGKIPVPGVNASEDAKRNYRDRIYKAFEAYPAPQFDAESEQWNYGTANAQRAAMNALAGAR